MTFKELSNIIEKNNVPKDVHLMSNSGWECCATEMDGVYYNPIYNEIHFTQDSEFVTEDDYKRDDIGSDFGENRDGWIILK